MPTEGATGGVVLVLADASTAREQLVTDLVVLGYRPLLHPEGDPSPSQPGPGIALILSDRRGIGRRDRIETRFLLVAERLIQAIERRPHSLHCLQHRP